MVSTPEPGLQSEIEVRSLVIRESKIIHRSPVLHPLARFVTEETTAMMFDIAPEQIERIECWRNIVYVHAEGVSRFVSYADFPAILGVQPPENQDFVLWRKRWRKRWHSRLAPEFWQRFYCQQFYNAQSVTELYSWGNLVNAIGSVLSQTVLEHLRQVFLHQRTCCQF